MQPISVLNLFPTYATREAYEQTTSKPCPAWDQTRAPKAWEDPAAQQKLKVGTVPYTVYDRIFVGFDAAGAPKFEPLGMPVSEAKTVNIPPKGEGMTNVPGTGAPEVPCPIRELEDDEILKPGFGNVPQVFRAAELVTVDTGFTQADRELLIKIANKVGA